MSTADPSPSPPAGLIDLASARIGGTAVVANDEFFAEKENLLKPGRGIFIPDQYTDRGKWMDGWESRRRRTPGHDWCVIQLGLRGIIKQVDIDTNHFLGNHPPFASLEGLDLTKGFPRELSAVEGLPWSQILAPSPLNPGSQNLFTLSGEQARTHVKLNIIPDGGVARFRAYGVVVPDWSKLKVDQVIDLAAIENGGVPLACSDMFFSSMNNLIMPSRSENMGDGWETKRRRGPGHDWIIVKLGLPGKIQKIEVDTNHFKGNYPDTCSIEGCAAADAAIDELTSSHVTWREVLPKTKLQAHTQHFFEHELVPMKNCTHIRLNIFPDGGVSRLRVWGTVE